MVGHAPPTAAHTRDTRPWPPPPRGGKAVTVWVGRVGGGPRVDNSAVAKRGRRAIVTGRRSARDRLARAPTRTAIAAALAPSRIRPAGRHGDSAGWSRSATSRRHRQRRRWSHGTAPSATTMGSAIATASGVPSRATTWLGHIGRSGLSRSRPHLRHGFGPRGVTRRGLVRHAAWPGPSRFGPLRSHGPSSGPVTATRAATVNDVGRIRHRHDQRCSVTLPTPAASHLVARGVTPRPSMGHGPRRVDRLPPAASVLPASPSPVVVGAAHESDGTPWASVSSTRSTICPPSACGESRQNSMRPSRIK